MRPEQIRRAYALYAPVYDRLFGLVFQHGRRATIDRLDAQPGERLLAVGVGTGLMLPLYPRHSRITGIDLSAEMLAKAQRRVAAQRMDHVELRLMDAPHLQFPDGSFDAVIDLTVDDVIDGTGLEVREVRRLSAFDMWRTVVCEKPVAV